MAIFQEHNLEPKVFFAPAHTFDLNTIKALKEETNIRIISDTVANKPYQKYGMTFVPQQSGNVRKLPFRVVTFCYHPNVCNEDDFVLLEKFINEHKQKFLAFSFEEVNRKFSCYDAVLRRLYFFRRR